MSAAWLPAILAQTADEGLGLWWIPIIIVSLVVMVALHILQSFFKQWLRCYMAQVPISMADLIGMGLQKANAKEIVEAAVLLKKGGLAVETEKLVAHDLAGGRVRDVARVMIASSRMAQPLDFMQVSAYDLAGRAGDLMDALKDARDGKYTIVLDPAAQDGYRRVGQDTARAASELVGARGRTTRTAHASGVVSVDGIAREAIFEDVGVEEGAEVEVVRVEDGRLVVRLVADAPGET